MRADRISPHLSKTNTDEPLENNLLSKILGRRRSMLFKDVENNEAEIRDKLKHARVLVIGAGGSIGGAFTRVLSNFAMQALHLVDISENNLVETVRNLHASGTVLPTDFRTSAIDFSLREFTAFLADVHNNHRPYDYILNFAALKHVRSERDPFTLMRMLNVNVVANELLCARLKGTGTRAFCVSSDKAVRPGNLMGASKALMERVFLSHAGDVPFTSARFANVAFSAGSLLDSFQHRLTKRQPLSAPIDVKRYFISHQEAGELCLLGCFLGNNREIVFPQFNVDKDMMSFADIARLTLQANDLTPIECDSADEALKLARSLHQSSKQWPCYFSASNTSGEKPYEEFVDPSETVDHSRHQKMGVVTAPIFHGADSVEQSLAAIKRISQNQRWTIDDLADAIQIAVPELNHIRAEHNLDQKL